MSSLLDDFIDRQWRFSAMIGKNSNMTSLLAYIDDVLLMYNEEEEYRHWPFIESII